jgi:hypothetical protein
MSNNALSSCSITYVGNLSNQSYRSSIRTTTIIITTTKTNTN